MTNSKNHETIKYTTIFIIYKIALVSSHQVTEETGDIFQTLPLNMLKVLLSNLHCCGHILLNCDSFKQTCPKYYQINNLKVFSNAPNWKTC